MYCGLLTFRLNLLLQEFGQTLVGAWGSAIYPIHLYNACRQSGDLDSEWEDAEYICQLHTPQRVFVGGPPKDPGEYFKRFTLMLGARTSAANFARNKRSSGRASIIESKKGPRGLKETSPMKDIFYPRYVENGNAVLSPGNLSALVAVANKAQRTHAPLCDIEQLSHEVTSQPHLTPVQLLDSVREGIAAEEMHLLFDYFGFHQGNIKLLRTLKTAVHEDLVKYVGDGYMEDESQLPFVIGYIFNIVRDTEIAAAQLKLPAHGSKVLSKASDVVKAFLENGNAGRRGLTQARMLTRAVQYAYAHDQLESVQIFDPQREQRERRGGV